jgi:hypothetical protein
MNSKETNTGKIILGVAGGILLAVFIVVVAVGGGCLICSAAATAKQNKENARQFYCADACTLDHKKRLEDCNAKHAACFESCAPFITDDFDGCLKGCDCNIDVAINDGNKITNDCLENCGSSIRAY